jgi:GNAT superfamily N-acetyltransferase
LRVLIRIAAVEDAPAVAELSHQLGYPVSEVEIAKRLSSYQGDLTHCVLAAEIGDKLVGWVDVSIASHLVAGEYGEIGGLIVASGLRGRGIGSRLLTAAEEWFKSRGVSKCIVRSRSTRLEAHRFYVRENYRLEKTSAVFSKELSN